MSEQSNKTKQILTTVLKLSPSDMIEDVSMKNTATWDSMAHLSIVTGLENEFDIFIEASEAELLISYSSIVDFLTNHPEL